MLRIYKIIVLIIFISSPLYVNAHVQHYEDLNRIKFDIYRNNKFIGTHIFSFKKLGDELTVDSVINFEIKKFGVVFYKYYVKGTEIYKDGKLIKFNSRTDQNGKEKYVLQYVYCFCIYQILYVSDPCNVVHARLLKKVKL